MSEEGEIEEGEIPSNANPSANNENVTGSIEPGLIVDNVDARATDRDISMANNNHASSIAKPTSTILSEPSGSNGTAPVVPPPIIATSTESLDVRPSTGESDDSLFLFDKSNYISMRSTVFGPGMRIIICQRGAYRAASIDFTYKINSAQFDLISKWNNWTKTTEYGPFNVSKIHVSKRTQFFL